MHDWIVNPGMSGFLDVCTHECLYVCIEAFCISRTEFYGMCNDNDSDNADDDNANDNGNDNDNADDGDDYDDHEA